MEGRRGGGKGSNIETYYQVLGVPRTAHQDDIRRAYRFKSLLLHPDRRRYHQGSQQSPSHHPSTSSSSSASLDATSSSQQVVSEAEAGEAFQKLSSAYHVLIDPQLRASYDRQLTRSTGLKRSQDGDAQVALIQGNEVFEALHMMRRYNDGRAMSLLNLLPQIKSKLRVTTATLRFREGVPCIGHAGGCRRVECVNLDDFGVSPSSLRSPHHPSTTSSSSSSSSHSLPFHFSSTLGRAFVCKDHGYLHVCEGDDCTFDGQRCPIEAQWLVRDWVRTMRAHPLPPPPNQTLPAEVPDLDDDEEEEEDKGNEENKSKTEDGNEETKEEKPKDRHTTTTKRRREHFCNPRRCNFLLLRNDVWMCSLGQVPHVCTSSECEWKIPLRQQDRDKLRPKSLRCWATGIIYSASEDSFAAAEAQVVGLETEQSAPFLEDEEDEVKDMQYRMMGKRKRVRYFNEATGKQVEVTFDVPLGWKSENLPDTERENKKKKQKKKQKTKNKHKVKEEKGESEDNENRDNNEDEKAADEGVTEQEKQLEQELETALEDYQRLTKEVWKAEEAERKEKRDKREEWRSRNRERGMLADFDDEDSDEEEEEGDEADEAEDMDEEDDEIGKGKEVLRHNKKKKKKMGLRERLMAARKTIEDSDSAEEEDVYSHTAAEAEPYYQYGAAIIDFPDHDRDQDWDTMRGECSDAAELRKARKEESRLKLCDRVEGRRLLTAAEKKVEKKQALLLTAQEERKQLLLKQQAEAEQKSEQSKKLM